jgi:site-specific DNA recombinase
MMLGGFDFDAAALYMRVSSEDQAERGTIEVQRDSLRNITAAHKIRIVEEYTDDGVSGAIPLEDRPAGRRMMEDAKRGRFKVVMFTRVDRLGRSLLPLIQAQRALDTVGVRIQSATENFETTTAIGQFMFQFLGSLAELERATIQERMTMGRDRHVRHGKWTNGPVPFGYDLDAEGRLMPSARIIDVLGRTEAEVMREIYERVHEGSTATAEAQRLNVLGVPCLARFAGGTVKKRTDTWHPSRMTYMLRNPLYAGRHVSRSRNGHFEVQVEPLVSQALWDDVQVALKRNRGKFMRPPDDRRSTFLRGLVRCGNCGAGMTPTPKYYLKSRKHPERRTYSDHYFRCNRQNPYFVPEPGKRCNGKLIPATWLEELVWEEVADFIRHPKQATKEVQRHLRERRTQAPELERRRSALQREVDAKTSDYERLLTALRKGRILDADFDSQSAEIAREKLELQAGIATIERQLMAGEFTQKRYQDMQALLTRLQSELGVIEREDDKSRKHAICEMLIAEIRITTHGEGRSKWADVDRRYHLGGGEACAENTRAVPQFCKLSTCSDPLYTARTSRAEAQYPVSADGAS